MLKFLEEQNHVIQTILLSMYQDAAMEQLFKIPQGQFLFKGIKQYRLRFQQVSHLQLLAQVQLSLLITKLFQVLLLGTPSPAN
jgi:hypothetical protein